MKTEIAQFCKKYEIELSSLEKVMRNTVACIRDEDETQALSESLSGLNEAHYRLKSLTEKIRNQQAYLLIFGPLKSGKSTLINAISGAYVSEVTAMPAYPCLVYVRHGQDQSFSVQRYEGDAKSLKDASEVQSLIHENHAQLAKRLSEVEESGRSFDPAMDFPQAIRRIDITLPVPNLAEAGTVLVDTPGLYSRMKFGYDMMTREFRNSAACAVFVVKTDNLFLEQVFDEFNELLDLFSRVFLVVNLDSNKQDLKPDGSLGPSVEKLDPAKIIEAFESLSMSSPLRRAFRQGRLAIYPIDLLTSASNSLKGEDEEPSDSKANESSKSPDPGPEIKEHEEEYTEKSGAVIRLEHDNASKGSEVESVDAVARVGERLESKVTESKTEDETGLGEWISESITTESEALDETNSDTPQPAEHHIKFSFDEFVEDLSDYLNSTEYLSEFIGDSLRQGQHLAEEVLENCHDSKLEGLVQYNQEMENRQNEQTDKQKAAAILKKEDLKATFSSLIQDNQKQSRELESQLMQELRDNLKDGLDQWFECSDSLWDLQEKYWRPVLETARKNLFKKTEDRMRDYLNRRHGGAVVSSQIENAVNRLGLSLEETAKASEIKLYESAATELGKLTLFSASISVRKTFLDWILFRSKSAVRDKLFGLGLDKEIDPVIKRKRLILPDQPGIQHVGDEHVQSKLPGLPLQISRDFLESYVKNFVKDTEQKIAALCKNVDEELQEMDRRITSNRRILASVQNLLQSSDHTSSAIKRLTLEHTREPVDVLENEGNPSNDEETMDSSERNNSAGIEESMADVSEKTGSSVESDEEENAEEETRPSY